IIGAFDTVKGIVDEIEKDRRFAETDKVRYFCFDNYFEMVLIEAFDSKCKAVVRNPLPYDMIYCAAGSALIDLGRMEEARAMLDKALYWGPASMEVRFEHMEFHKMCGDLSKYLIESLENTRYIQTVQNASRYYRSIAYTFTERKKYDVAAALSIKSLNYEESKFARDEIAYCELNAKEPLSQMSEDEVDRLLDGVCVVNPFEISSHIALPAAEELLSKGKTDIAKDIFGVLADQGDIYARLMCSLLEGGTSSDKVAAVLRLAGEGRPDAMHAIGLCHLHGHGVERSGEKAFEWFEKSASLLYVPALIQAGECCENGIGTSISKEEALRHLAKALLKGSTLAVRKVERLHVEKGWNLPAFYDQEISPPLRNSQKTMLLENDPLDASYLDADRMQFLPDVPGESGYVSHMDEKVLFRDGFGLLPQETLMISLCTRFIVGDDDFPMYWELSYNVYEPAAMLDSLEKRGFIKKSRDPRNLLNRKTAQDIKNLRSSFGLKSSGKKEALIERTLKEVTASDIQNAFPETVYVPTEKGLEDLSANYQVRALHNHRVLHPFPFNVHFKGKGCSNKWELARMCVEWRDCAPETFDIFIDKYVEEETGYTMGQLKYYLRSSLMTDDGVKVPSHAALLLLRISAGDDYGPEFREGLFCDSIDKELDALESAGLIDRSGPVRATPSGEAYCDRWGYLGSC
ncbi:MAG: SEL1-like repeat protein, partial [Spirochaetales bacterium]|nr:SEL1-like repeat protein [Spirochaetales bacterium]